MVLFNNPYYKKNYLSERQAAIMLGIVEVPKSFKIFKSFENRDFPKQPIEEALEVVKTLNELIEPEEDPIGIKEEISKLI